MRRVNKLNSKAPCTRRLNPPAANVLEPTCCDDPPGTRAGFAAHIRTMTTARDEAQDPATPPERLHELISLPGNRGDIDSDAGWCREYVAANPNAGPETLAELAADWDDFMARLGVAGNPATPESLVRTLIDDHNDQVANAARKRLSLEPRPRPGVRIAGGRFLDPRTGRLR